MEPLAAPYQELLDIIGLPNSKVAAIYLRGSRGVGVGTEISDYDYVVVTLDEFSIDEIRVLKGKVDFTMFDLKGFQRQIEYNEIGTMECIFSKPHLLNIIDPKLSYKLNKYFLLNSTLRVVKYRRGRYKTSKERKNLFIATRYMAYAIELFYTETIKDIGCMNYIWYEKDETKMEALYKEFKMKIKAEYNKILGIKQLPKSDDESPLEVVNQLRKLGLKQFCIEYKIDYRRHPQYPHLVQFYYKSHAPITGIVKVTRGIILNQNENWSVVAYPFNRFNIEYQIEKIDPIKDFESYDIYRKYDGSLCILYWYDDKWHVASSITPDGSALLSKKGKNIISLKEAFWKLFNENKYEMPKDRDFTYMFELTLKDHIVVTEESDQLIFLGMRNIKTFQETHFNKLELNWKTPQKIEMSEKELLSLLMAANPREIEGVVLHNPETHFRIKLKTSGYHDIQTMYPLCVQIKIGWSNKFLLQRIYVPDFLERCPEYKYVIKLLQFKLKKMFDHVIRIYETTEPSTWNKSIYKGLLYGLKRGVSPEESFKGMLLKKKLALVEEFEKSF